jgi:hypothetical protein
MSSAFTINRDENHPRDENGSGPVPPYTMAMSTSINFPRENHLRDESYQPPASVPPYAPAPYPTASNLVGAPPFTHGHHATLLNYDSAASQPIHPSGSPNSYIPPTQHLSTTYSPPHVVNYSATYSPPRIVNDPANTSQPVHPSGAHNSYIPPTQHLSATYYPPRIVNYDPANNSHPVHPSGAHNSYIPPTQHLSATYSPPRVVNYDSANVSQSIHPSGTYIPAIQHPTATYANIAPTPHPTVPPSTIAATYAGVPQPIHQNSVPMTTQPPLLIPLTTSQATLPSGAPMGMSGIHSHISVTDDISRSEFCKKYHTWRDVLHHIIALVVSIAFFDGGRWAHPSDFNRYLLDAVNIMENVVRLEKGIYITVEPDYRLMAHYTDAFRHWGKIVEWAFSDMKDQRDLVLSILRKFTLGFDGRNSVESNRNQSESYRAAISLSRQNNQVSSHFLMCPLIYISHSLVSSMLSSKWFYFKHSIPTQGPLPIAWTSFSWNSRVSRLYVLICHGGRYVRRLHTSWCQQEYVILNFRHLSTKRFMC